MQQAPPGYRALAPLGAGGTASIHRAVHERSGRAVAIKVFERPGDPRAEREAAALARVSVPLAPRLFETGVLPDGRVFVAMELIERDSLAEWMRARGGAATWTEVEPIARAAAAAVDRVHEVGVAHRDLKPAHLFVADDRATLIDFGLARVTAGDHGSSAPAAELTREGDRFGTPRYMAPEQCRGHLDVGPSADVYSLGVILYELLAGAPPFIGDAAEIRAAHVSQRPPALPGAPAAVTDVLGRFLAKDPALRFRRAVDGVDALAAAFATGADRSDGAERPTRAPPRRAPIALLGLNSAIPVVELERRLAGRAVVVRVDGDRVTLAFPDAASPATGVRAAVRLAEEFGGGVVHVGDCSVTRRPRGVRVRGEAARDPALWRAADETVVTRAAADLLDPTATRDAESGYRALVSASDVDAPDPPLRGRDAFVDRLVDGVRAGAIATVVGDTGLGKSRLLRELESRLRATGWRVCHARYEPGGRPVAVLADDIDRFALAEIEALEQCARDGLAWVCATAAPRFTTRRPGWGAEARASEVHELVPLDARESRAVVRDLLAPAEFVPDAVVDRIADAGAGVPLQLVELARALRACGALRSGSGDGVYVATDELVHIGPTPLAERIARASLAAMSPALRRFAGLCAAIGERGSHAALDKLQRRTDGPWMDVGVGLDRLEQADLIVREPDGWRFRNPLVARGVAAATPAEVSAPLHRAALDALPDDNADHTLRARARHARAVGERDLAYRALFELAERQRERYDDAGAERDYTAALELARDDDDRIDVHGGRARVRYRLQRFHDALADSERAIELARAAGRDADATRLHLLEAVIYDWSDAVAKSRAAVEAAAEIAAADPALHAALQAGRGLVAFREERLDAAAELLSNAADEAAATRDLHTRVIALLLLGPALICLDRADEAKRRYDEVIRLCAGSGDRFHLCAAYTNRQFLWMRLDRLDDAIADLRESIALARSLGHAQLERVGSHNLAEVLHWLGDDDQALPLARASQRLQRAFTAGDEVPDDTLLVARVLAFLGRNDEAAVELDWVRDHARVNELAPSHAALLAMTELLVADADELSWRGLIDRWGDDVQLADQRLELRVAAAECALRGGRYDDAARWVDLAQGAQPLTAAWKSRLSALAERLRSR